MQKFVNVEGVNVRSGPTVGPDNLIGAIYLGQSVEDLGDGPDGWRHLRAEIGGKQVEGFSVATLPVSKVAWTPPEQPTLREPSSAAREALVAAAVEQWLRFNKGKGQEALEPYSGYVRGKWKAFKQPYTGKNTKQSWSAVAVSLMVRNAAKKFEGYKAFKESIGHAEYMWDAVRKNASGDTAELVGEAIVLMDNRVSA